ncbi:asparagine synthase (glutamine-hydrolyzing) [Fodinibius sediminis]|uniref:asparagine synthase (glutamine-hydrolyzing) n=1 Tax=Fodinibius sediminis TaxID=1214077 RepID=A0A521B3H2_9BACT|nr:asparagine synthase (glutamine-hydrolyzing) [Fodinibius sediminis]SMO41595.1 asparagine synthase (glutamine-hydrolysing) [Fodinibius sediminis]
MCGLAGYINLSHRKEDSIQTIWQMIDLQKHRGPDDSAVLSIDTDKGLGEVVARREYQARNAGDLFFGFNRLSILDLSSNGRQPMVSDDGQVALMMNGEIYNAFDYKETLELKGYKFKSTTDTEIVLKLYLEYGIDGMLKKLNGMFAIAIWDMRLKCLFLTRDRFGIKPLYILRGKDRLAFSSEIKSFQVLPDFSFELDKSKLDEFLLFRNVINDTLFTDIHNCTPGTYVSVNHSGDIKEHVYYDVNTEGTIPIAKEKSFSTLGETLEQSVNRQMISDVKLGCQLSGGVDSSLVTYYAEQSLDQGALETISINFSNPSFSEEKYIDEVTQKLNLHAHKYLMDPEYYFNNLENATWHFEQPLNHPNTIGIYYLSEEAKKHVTVLLSGEGADEALAGYDRFVNTVSSAYFNRKFLSKLKQNSADLLNFLRYYINDGSRLIMDSSFGSLATVKDIYPEFNFRTAMTKRAGILNNLSGDRILKHRKYELKTYLPDLLMRQDKMSMAHSIENRVPFLDNEMVKISLGISGKELIDKRNGRKEAKLLLKKLCREKFGDEFAFRRKKGFGIPLKDFMKSSDFQSKWLNEIEPGIKKRNIFHTKVISKWVANVEHANPAQLDAIWLMTAFEVWAKKYLDQ